MGHSQGGALLLMLLANMPLYNSAISINLNIAPVVHAKYIQSPILVSFFRSANVGAGAGPGRRATAGPFSELEDSHIQSVMLFEPGVERG